MRYTTDWVSYRQQLEDLRLQYTNRRSVPYQLLNDAVRLAEATVAELEVTYQAHTAEAERQHQIQLARAEDRAQRAEDRVRALEAMRTNMRETRETIEDGVLVKIAAPRTYNNRTDEEERYGRPWTIGELDTVIYRLRLGGGTDDTEVRIKHDHTEATIPFPELVMEAPTKLKPVAEVVAPRPWWRRRALVIGIATTAVNLVLAAIILLVGSS